MSTWEELIQNDPYLKRMVGIISKVGAESERGMTILVAAELDRALELVLKAYLVPGKARDELFLGVSPPLGTFSTKINVARALDLIGADNYEALHLIRKIRNEFAHNPDASFGDARVKAWTEKLPDHAPISAPKERFELCGSQLITELEIETVDAANGRVYEESYNTFYRRGAGPDFVTFASKEEAAEAYRDKKGRRGQPAI
ncbi:hypothetical protein AB4099_05415 [Bosea sp. 2KB_26]|uniref:DUF4145 domain-containing protein n=1 Tax=Bosea sp. 2KB_26 TaxID=3237475 RepID=UPI003F938B8E